jgi:hypothetical protein
MENDHKRFLKVLKSSAANQPTRNPDLNRAPAFRRLMASVRSANSLIAPDTQLTNFELTRLEAFFHAGMAADEQCAEKSLLEFEQAMMRLSELIESHPEAGEKAAGITQSLVRTYGFLIRDFVFRQGNREMATVRPLIEQNTAKAAAVERAKAIAAELWQSDTAQEIRIGEMAERVYRALAAEGFASSLPGTAERLKDWIKPIAPDYARKGGRRRKTP